MRKIIPALILVATLLAGCNFPTKEVAGQIPGDPSGSQESPTQAIIETATVLKDVDVQTATLQPTKEATQTAAPTITPTPAPISLPPRSCGEPDGTILYLAMQSDNGGKDILTIKPDGSEFTEIHEVGYVEQFLIPHPSGKSFLYQNNLTYFFTKSMDGSNRVQLTDRLIYPDEVKYSPDGTKIAYIAFFGKRRHIYIMDADGTSMFNLTDFQPEELDDFEYPTDLWSFDWSPNSAYIIFEAELNNQHDIFVVESDGGKLRNMTNTPDLNEHGPVYSPGGTLIAYSADSGSGSEIYLMRASGADPTQLTTLGAHSTLPTWSNDGHQIAFISDRDGDEEVYVIDPDGDDFGQLTFNSTREYWLGWSPDSCWLAYRSVVDGTGISEIFRTSPDGNETFQITEQNSWILRFYWVDE